MEPVRRASILVVEDDPLVREMIVDVCSRRASNRSRPAAPPRPWRTADQPIDAVITDIDMPGELDGIELARRIGELWPALASPPASRLHDDADLRPEFADAPRELDPIEFAGHVYVGDDGIDRMMGECAQALGGAAGLERFEARVKQNIDNHLADERVVFDDENIGAAIRLHARELLGIELSSSYHLAW